jgi:two-component system chemotaxis sensor kinase CheA
VPNHNEEFLKKLLGTFRIEAGEHIQAMSSGLLELEKSQQGPGQTAIVEKIYREAHSLKGAARAVNFGNIESICQSLESVYAALKKGELSSSPQLLDLLYQAIDAIDNVLAQDPSSQENKPSIASLTKGLEGALKGNFPGSPDTSGMSIKPALPSAGSNREMNGHGAEFKIPAAAPDTSLETIRVPTASLDGVMKQAEELLAPRLAAHQRTRDLHETVEFLAQWKKERARIQPALRSLERAPDHPRREGEKRKSQQTLIKIFEYLENENLAMKRLEDQLRGLEKMAEHDCRTLTGMVDSLLKDVREMHMLPFSSLLEILPRFVREFARDHGKQVELVTQGTDIEIDRRILEAIKEPLIHLIRNGIDHGIEKPEIRQAGKKQPQGTIRIEVSQKDSGKVEIIFEDDGAGIDPVKVKDAARKLGIRTADEIDKLGEQDILNLVFQSGVSTNSIITDASGRGLGLAIVREKVDGLGGNISVSTTLHAGTRFRIVLPLMLSTFRGVLLRVAGHDFVLPSINVEQVLRVPIDEIRTVENLETIPLDGQSASLVWLSSVLELPGKAKEDAQQGNVQVVVIGLGNERIAFRVDEIIGEQEVLVKALGPQLSRVRNVAGASVLGTGQVVPVLNAQDLMKSAIYHASAPVAPISTSPQAQKRSILVAEDSITSRSLLKNILESANYRVSTAVDGIDAFTTLKSGKFDLLVSDVEMPRLDGFGLAAKVRSDKQLLDLPIVLVTALESREHRERGIDVGANAYIVKSSFDQSNLLDVISRLI